MKLAIIGATGQLGTDLQQVLSAEHDVIALNHADIEIIDIDSVKKVSATKPDAILNTAAFHVCPMRKNFPLVVKRPFYSVLENTNLKKQGIDQMPHWKDALKEFLIAERTDLLG